MPRVGDRIITLRPVCGVPVSTGAIGIVVAVHTPTFISATFGGRGTWELGRGDWEPCSDGKLLFKISAHKILPLAHISIQTAFDYVTLNSREDPKHSDLIALLTEEESEILTWSPELRHGNVIDLYEGVERWGFIRVEALCV